MSNEKSKVVVLADYAKARALLTLEDAQNYLNERRIDLRLLDIEVIKTLSTSHTLKDIQGCKNKSVKIENSLINTFDWLEDKIQETDSDAQKKSAETLLKECEQLISRSERIKKTISDDMAACRYTESKGTLNPAQAFGIIVAVTGGTAMFFKTFLATRLDVAVSAGGAAAVVGTYAAFYKRINQSYVTATQTIAAAPQHISALKENARFSIIAAAMTASVAMKQSNEIKPRYPSSNTAGYKVIISAKL